MSVVLWWYTRDTHMVHGDTGHKFICIFGRRPRPPRASRPRHAPPRAPRVRRFVLLMYLPALVRRPRCWRGIRYARAYPVPAEPGLA
jgi:hypothetical protein